MAIPRIVKTDIFHSKDGGYLLTSVFVDLGGGKGYFLPSEHKNGWVSPRVTTEPKEDLRWMSRRRQLSDRNEKWANKQ